MSAWTGHYRCVLISNSVNIKSIDVWKKCQCIGQIQVDCELGQVTKLCKVAWNTTCPFLTLNIKMYEMSTY